MWDKRKQKTEVDKTNKFKYLDSLDDNTPRAFDEYNAEASILDREISKPSVCNIAVVAKYGAGKSSVINTYLHNYRRTKKEAKKNVVLGKPEKNKYSRITLATFNNANYDETAIERSILQQLLYSRKKSELPNSAVKRTNRTSLWKSLLFAFLLSAFILSIVFFSFEISGVYIWGKQINWVKYVFLGIISCSLIFFVFWLIYSKKLKRIKYKEFEVEMFAGKDENPIHTVSLINKFIDEVLYFFECVDINLVIFEDLDRLPTTEIFAKLRELNTILYLAINAEVDIELDKIKEYLKALGGWWAKLYEEGSQKVKQDNNIEKILKALKNREVIKYRRSNKIEEFLGRPGFIVQVK